MQKQFFFLILLLGLAGSLARAQWFTPEPKPAPTLETLHVRIQALEAKLTKKEVPADPQNLPLLRFKLEQVRLLLQEIESNQPPYILRSPYDQTKSAVETTLERAESVARAQGDAVYPATGQMHERAYIAANDGSVQPYWVFVPKDYTPRRTWPLVVFLHGYSPSITKIAPWIPGPDIWQHATDRGFIMAVPYGRRNSDFVGIGEDDTLAVTDAVTAKYNVDPDRTFLLGPSMGGYGVHAVGLHNPDRFAALSTLCARTDFYLWFDLQREQVPQWKRVLYDADDPRHLKRNAFQLPIFMQHGALDDIVSVEHSRRFYADLKALNFPAFYREIRDGTHYIYWQYATFQIALDWMRKLKRAPQPRRVLYTTGSLRNHRTHWVSIRGFDDYSKLAHIDAEIKDANVVQVAIENVSGFELRLPAQFIDAALPVSMIVNGVKTEVAVAEGNVLSWKRSGADLRKTPQRSGPIKEVYRDPFLLVFGTLKGGANEISAKRFQNEWDLYADGLPPIKADRDVTEQDKERYNLILFGTRESNSLLAGIADTLPLELTPDGYRIGQREYSRGGETIGLQFCYPSPFHSGRMIVVQSGHFWGDALPINHKHDLLPEYIVYTDERDPSDSTNQALAAGFFDGDWQLPANIERPTPNIEHPT